MKIILKTIGICIHFQFIISFDFFLILLSIFSNTLLSILGLVKSVRVVKAGRIVKLAKLNRAFRLFRVCRTLRYFKVLEWGFTTLADIRNLIFRIILCAPLGKYFNF